MKATHETQLKAFLVAIDRIDPPLPEAAEDKIHQIAIAISQKHDDRAMALIYELTQTYPTLRERYDAARLDVKRQYQAQERSKSAIATLDKTGTDLEQTAILLLTQFSHTSTTLFTDSLKSEAVKSGIWEKSDRAIALAAGGAFLGGAIGQILSGGVAIAIGAILGTLFAGIYGWYSSSAEARSNRQI
jgi:hypothetical protein